MSRPKFFYGWWIVLASATMNYYMGGTFFYGFTVFFTPIMNTFGWSYAATSVGMSLQRLEGGILAPLAGFFADRVGPRKLMFGGTAVAGFGFILLSRVDSLWAYYVVFLILSAGLGAMTHGGTTVAAAAWFRRKIGRAMGFLYVGMGLSGTLMPLMVWLIAQYGWRNTLFLVGIGIWVLGFPISLLMRRRPEDYGQVPDGEAPPETGKDPPPAVATAVATAPDFTVRQAMATPAFWLFTVAMLLHSMAHSGFFVHEVPFLISVGIPQETAAVAGMFILLTSLGGRLGFSWLADILDKRHVLAMAFALQATGTFLFAYTSEVWQLVPFIIIFSSGYGGTMPLRPIFQRAYFGRAAFGTIQGIIMAFGTVGAISGPVVVGWLRDITGTYQPAFLLLGAATTLAILPILWAGPPQEPKPVRETSSIIDIGGKP